MLAGWAPAGSGAVRLSRGAALAGRWEDVFAPTEAGTYTLSDSLGRELAMSFSRVDEDTIQVDVEGGRRPVAFRVTAAGQVQDGT